MKVSIVIPIFNVSNYLESCLQSCIEQTHKNIEIICVNDGSTDACCEIIDRFSQMDKRIIHLQKVNAGLPLARKSGIERATGEYIFHLDGDDNIPQNTIERLVEKAIEENADIVIGDYLTFNEGISYKTESKISETLTSIEYMQYILTIGLFNIWGKLIRSQLYKQNRIEFPPNIVIAEDLVATFQLAYYANRITATQSVVYNYYIRNTSMSNEGPNLLVNRSILAVNFIFDFQKAHLHNETLKPQMDKFLIHFILSYLQSPYPIKNQHEILSKLVASLSIKSSIQRWSRHTKCIISICRMNLYWAKHLIQTANKVKRICQ